ncbi:unnamed protein product [Camellia sinensis]
MACAFARYNFPAIIQYLQLLRAHALQIFQAPSDTTFCLRALCRDGNREIVSVNQAHVIETWFFLVHLEGEFNKCDRRKAYFTLALELLVTVACFTGGLPVGFGVGVEVASCSSPNAAAPCPGGLDGFCLAWWKVEASVGYYWLPFVWGSCGPYREGAFIAHINAFCKR